LESATHAPTIARIVGSADLPSTQAMPTASPGPANEAAFAQPHWRVIAQGFDTERWFNDGQAVGTGGILMPQPTRLPSGQYYYGFACSTSPRAAQVGGGGGPTTKTCCGSVTSRGNGYRLRDAARLM
jgi:hypothetical protein